MAHREVRQPAERHRLEAVRRQRLATRRPGPNQLVSYYQSIIGLVVRPQMCPQHLAARLGRAQGTPGMLQVESTSDAADGGGEYGVRAR